ncbi:MAG: NADH-quinone oxidoreductase subunit E [Pseudomonadota bacterium]
MLRRLILEQPEAFAFTDANRAWAEAQIQKYPEGRQASAIIPLLWRAQEQEGWLSKPAIEHVAGMLDMAYIRALEVATFYFMFQLRPVGSVAHVQVCGTTPCMLCGAEDLVAVCREKIAQDPHALSSDGTLSWEEVECLGACANAPMVQIGKDFYEDLDRDSFAAILDAFARGEVPEPGSRKGRFASEPEGGLTSLEALEQTHAANASVALARAKGDTVARILAESPGVVPDAGPAPRRVEPPLAPPAEPEPEPEPQQKAEPAPIVAEQTPPPAAEPAPKAKPEAPAAATPAAAKPASPEPEAVPAGAAQQPEALAAARDGTPDDLKQIKGIGPKLEQLCFSMGFYHFDQIAGWSAAEIAWVDANLKGFKGRVTRDDWVAQAKLLAEGGETSFSKRVKKGGVY